jgi:hypothetical protein
MYLNDLWASCKRRFYLIPVMVALVAGLVWIAAGYIGPQYEGKASVVLVPPTSSEDPDLNRYLSLGSVTYSVDVLARSMTSSDTVRELQREAPGVKYTVTSDPATSAPMIVVTTESSDKAAAGAMMRAILRRIPENLENLQEALNIGPDQQIVAVPIASDRSPETTNKSRIRLLGVLAVGLLFGGAVAIAALDGLLLRRERARKLAATAARAREAAQKSEVAIARRAQAEARLASRSGAAARPPTKRGAGKGAPARRTPVKVKR